MSMSLTINRLKRGWFYLFKRKVRKNNSKAKPSYMKLKVFLFNLLLSFSRLWVSSLWPHFKSQEVFHKIMQQYKENASLLQVIIKGFIYTIYFCLLAFHRSQWREICQMSEDPPFFNKVLLDNYIGIFIFFSANITCQWHNVFWYP